MARSDKEWIEDILCAIGDIRSDTAGMGFTAFSQNPVVIRSVLYSVSVIGEAVKQISVEFKAARPEISWRAIGGMRDRIVHEYFRTNTSRIWDVVIDDLDPLEQSLRGKRGTEVPPEP
jgi:uncharacterized protein with HEPN domain